MNQGYKLMDMWRRRFGAEGATVDAIVMALEKLEEGAMIEKIKNIIA